MTILGLTLEGQEHWGFRKSRCMTQHLVDTQATTCCDARSDSFRTALDTAPRRA